ncbi:stage III sporulation protein AA [Anaerosinus gibii]|uniref:Stage III sporulation protein AA n=1 Tax=Selenobaculum gibii TaxID=3054208 RepID=A0A9Y2AL52_9FIRM|nr:stage III sporulation protein AA [Selenobaculum gbiensis]WIW71685.1 stage III sporulation protein AA [Selenobaculum gbiensis]
MFFTEIIHRYLPKNLIELLMLVDKCILEDVIEIRFRVNQPVLLIVPAMELVLKTNGNSYICKCSDLQKIMQMISKNSIYALEEELKLGFITIEGGHRVGFVGKAIMDHGHIKALKNISSLNFRIAKSVIHCARPIIPYLIKESHVLNTLIVAPPRAGKTTLLRDLIRNFSNGCSFFKGVQVGVVDERSELAAVRDGVPCMDIGMRTDILDGCPKAEGILMLIRTMAPAVIVTDELGRKEDVVALEEALHAGVSVISTVHGSSISDIANRPYISDLIRQRYFERYIILTNKPSIGTVKEIIDAKTEAAIFSI